MSSDPICLLRSGEQPISSLSFLLDNSKTDDNLLISGTADGSLRFWDYRNSQRVRSCIDQAHAGSSILSAMQIDRDSLVTQARDGTIKRWQTAGSADWRLVDSSEQFRFVSYCPAVFDRRIRLVALPAPDSAVVLANPDDNFQLIKRLQSSDLGCQHGMAMRCAFDDSRLYVAYESGTVAVYDVRTWEKLDDYRVQALQTGLTAMAVRNGGGGLALVGTESSVFFVDQSGGQSERRLEAASGFADACYRNDGKLLALGGFDSSVWILSGKTRKLLVRLGGAHRSTVNRVVFDKDNLVVAGGKDGLISVWRPY